MYVKKLKRKCSVRGCKCTDTYAISLTREVGNTVIICKSCLGKALGAIDDVKPAPEVRVSHSEAPALFFNSQSPEQPAPVSEQVPTTENDPDTEPTPEEITPEDAESPAGSDADTNPPAESSEHVCPHCGQVCKTEQGLQKHIASKHKDEE